MSMGEAWRKAFNDREGQVRPHYEEHSVHLEDASDRELSLKSYVAGAVKTWVHKRASHPGR